MSIKKVLEDVQCADDYDIHITRNGALFHYSVWNTDDELLATYDDQKHPGDAHIDAWLFTYRHMSQSTDRYRKGIEDMVEKLGDIKVGFMKLGKSVDHMTLAMLELEMALEDLEEK